MNAAQIEDYERCPRRFRWKQVYVSYRVSPLAALYSGLNAGLTGSDAANEVMRLAANPGLDLEGVDVYGVAVHLSRLAEILALYLLAGEKAWSQVQDAPGWGSAAYECEEEIRRVVLIDRWTEERKMQEIRSWRTVGEICVFERPMLLNFINIGSSVDHRRISPWTRALTHPRNNQLRFKKKNGTTGFSENWEPVWRERWPGATEQWLAKMQNDSVFEDLIHSVRVSVPPCREEYMEDMNRLRREMDALSDVPPMRRLGCYRFGACEFVSVCHAARAMDPDQRGWIRCGESDRHAVTAEKFANC